jgi:hypothetical protein
MLSVVFSRVRDGEEARLRAWGRELGQRADEVCQTFEQEGVRHEKMLLLQTVDGPVLLRIGEVEDWDRAIHAFEHSTLRIDAEHRSVMDTALDGPYTAELIYECSL